MRKFELILGIVGVFGVLLKLANLPWSNVVTVLSFTLLSMLYMMFGFALFNGVRLRHLFKKSAYKGVNSKRIIGSIALGFAFMGLISGSLFKLQFWPDAMRQLESGLIMVGFVSAIALISFIRKKEKEPLTISEEDDTYLEETMMPPEPKTHNFYNGIFKRIVIYGGFSIALYLTPYPTLVDVFHRNEPEYAELLKKVLEQPDNVELQQELRQLQEKQLEQPLNQD